MQAQRPPQMPQLPSQIQKNPAATGAAGVKPQAQSDAAKSTFVGGVFPTIIMLSALAGLCVLGWYAYRESTSPRDLTDLPMIKADNAPFKIKPLDPGGDTISNLDKHVFDTISVVKTNKTNVVQVAPIKPSVEEPLARSVIKEMSAAAPVPEPEAAPVKTSQIIEEPATEVVNKAKDNAKKVPFPVPEYYTNGVEEKEDSAFNKVPVPVVRPASQAKKPKAVAVIPPPASMPTAKAKVVAPVINNNNDSFVNGVKIQLGAFRSTEEAKSTWTKIKAKHTSILGKLKYGIQKADLGSKGIFYRLHVGPINDKADASLICKKLTAKKQGCFIVK